MSDRSGHELPLAPLQRWFTTVMTHPDSVSAGIAQAAAEIPGASAHDADCIRPNARQTATERLAVYHHAYTARLIACLIDDYPALADALAQPWRAFAASYIERYPSKSPTLNRFGEHMSAFCAAQSDAHSAFYAELAQLEWAVVEVIHAHDGEPISLATLGALSPEAWGLHALIASPALRLLETRYPVNAYYQAFREQRAQERPAPEPSFTVVRRRAGLVVRDAQSPLAGKLLAALLSGEPIGQALETAAAGGMTPEQVGASFETWIGSGYFVGVVATV